MLTRGDVTELTSRNLGKPFWSLEAQCAGVFGAGYAFERNQGNPKQAESDKDAGVAMLDRAIYRLQIDRGLDRAGAMALAEPEVDYGRGVAKPMLDADGTGPDSQWNWTRSACLDIDDAARKYLNP